MDLKQAKKILNKINRLYDSMTMDDEAPDVFERDLMLSYIRQLYASFGAEEAILPEPPPPPRVTTNVAPPPVEEVKVEVIPEPEPEPVVEEEIKVPEIEPVPEPKAEKAPPPPPAPEPVVEKVVKEEPLSVPNFAPPSAALNPEEHEILFEQKEAAELSEKLSQRPIKDIFKAMSINERIFTLNELFDGDKPAFDFCLDKLNGFSHFSEAKEFLTNEIAGRYNWLQTSKKKKAKNFIKLVRRRYQ